MFKFINLYFLLSIITLFVNASSIKDLIEENEKVQDKEAFYMVFIAKNTTTTSFGKRQETVKEEDQEYVISSFVNEEEDQEYVSSVVDEEEDQEYVYSVVEEIHNLIMGNKDTFKDQEKFEDVEIQDSKLRKRDSKTHYLLDYGDSSYVYPVASLQNTTLINAYLSPELVETVQSMPNVVSVTLPFEYKPTSDDYYNTEDILKETKWKNLGITYATDLHLSLISQGKYSEDLIDQYDSNYYYPGSAGEDIDIFIFDTGFNFEHNEFSNKNYERKAECTFYVKGAKISDVENKSFCLSTYTSRFPIDKNHGTMVATIAGGMNHGVAKKANIYGVLMERYYNEDVIAGLKYIKDNFFRPGKAVFNFSFTGYAYLYKLEKEPAHAELQALIKELSDQGAVFVSSAGNDSSDTYDLYYGDIVAPYPCAYENEICVGGIANNVKSNLMNSTLYKLDKESNYGEIVDVYAPYHVKVEYISTENKIINNYVCGTSFSSPIVAGVAATIMSENPDIKYTSNFMLEYLTDIGEKNIISGIPKDYPSVFINNGKRTVLSSNQIYHGCGVHSGNKKCSNDECCSIDGHCTTDEYVCKINNGCQSDYGLCQ